MLKQEPATGRSASPFSQPSAAQSGASGPESVTPAAPPYSAREPSASSSAAEAGAATTSPHAAIALFGHWSDPPAALARQSPTDQEGRLGRGPDRQRPAPSPDPTKADKKSGPDPQITLNGSNERLLSSDPKYATSAYVPWFQSQVLGKVTPWGLTFDPGSVKLESICAKDQATDAIVLQWSADWGTAPTALVIPANMSSIDARAAVTGAKQLKGWSLLATHDSSTLENLLGGETNQLSIAVRDHLRSKFQNVATKDDKTQASELKAVLHVKDSVPSWIAEPVPAAAVQVGVTGPTEIKDYAFSGKKADGEAWIAKFSDSVEFTIIAPKGPTPGYHNHTVQDTAEAASHLSKQVRSMIKKVMLNPITNPQDPYWATQYKRPNFHSYMTAGVDGIVTIYPEKAADALSAPTAMSNAMVHETGHTWSYKTWGVDTTKGKWQDWKKAMAADKVAISGYATSSIVEDVAETIRLYQISKGTPTSAEYQKIVPHRFAILSQEYDK